MIAKVDGVAGYLCGSRSLNLDITINGDHKRLFGDRSKSMKLNLLGDYTCVQTVEVNNIKATVHGNLDTSLPARSNFGKWTLYGDINTQKIFGTCSKGNCLYVIDDVFNKRVRGKELFTKWEHKGYKPSYVRYENMVFNMKTNEKVIVPWKFEKSPGFF